MRSRDRGRRLEPRRSAPPRILTSIAATAALLPCAVAQGAAPAAPVNPCGPALATASLASTTNRTGLIDLYHFGPAGSPVTFFECVGERAHRLGEVTSASGSDRTILYGATAWACDRQTRHFATTTAKPRRPPLRGYGECAHEVVCASLRARCSPPRSAGAAGARSRGRSLGPRRHPDATVPHVASVQAPMPEHRVRQGRHRRDATLPPEDARALARCAPGEEVPRSRHDGRWRSQLRSARAAPDATRHGRLHDDGGRELPV